MACYDIVVIGGGPSGIAAAIELVRSGFTVAIVEKSAYETDRAGEVLLPEGCARLSYLNAWEAFLDDGHVPSWGIRSLWGNEPPFENDFIFNPYGNGWRLDRTRFDRMLVQVAAGAGVTVLRNTQIAACEFREPEQWRLSLRAGSGEIHETAARFLVDATERRAWLARRQGSTRRTLDRLVAIAGTRIQMREAEPNHLGRGGPGGLVVCGEFARATSNCGIYDRRRPDSEADVG